MKNTFGSAVSLTIFGESHGPAIGAVLDGLAAGLPVEEQFIAECMDRRRARGDGLSTSRTEPDRVEILSGVLDGHTTGTPVTLIVRNTNTRSGDYARTAALLRPGHADYTAWAKYEGFQDARGGGHFSGRITAASVAAGAICQQVLARLGIQVYTHIARCAGIPDAALPADGTLPAPAAPGHFSLVDPGRETAMQEAIRAAGAAGDSVGGILETVVTGLPAGVGEPFFDSVESELSHLMFSVPAVKGIEFGAGVPVCRPERQHRQRPLPHGRKRPGGHRHQPQRRRQRRHHQRHAGGVPHGGQAHPQHLQGTADRGLSRPGGCPAGHPRPARSLHRAPGRGGAEHTGSPGNSGPDHGALRHPGPEARPAPHPGYCLNLCHTQQSEEENPSWNTA